jgi:hypothetical protein
VRVSTFDCNPRSSSIDGGPPHPQSSVACPSLSHGTDVEAVRTLPATCCLLRTFLRLLSWGRPRSSGVAVVFVHKVSKVRCFTRKNWDLHPAWYENQSRGRFGILFGSGPEVPLWKLSWSIRSVRSGGLPANCKKWGLTSCMVGKSIKRTILDSELCD